MDLYFASAFWNTDPLAASGAGEDLVSLVPFVKSLFVPDAVEDIPEEGTDGGSQCQIFLIFRVAL